MIFRSAQLTGWKSLLRLRMTRASKSPGPRRTLFALHPSSLSSASMFSMYRQVGTIQSSIRMPAQATKLPSQRPSRTSSVTSCSLPASVASPPDPRPTSSSRTRVLMPSFVAAHSRRTRAWCGRSQNSSNVKSRLLTRSAGDSVAVLAQRSRLNNEKDVLLQAQSVVGHKQTGSLACLKMTAKV